MVAVVGPFGSVGVVVDRSGWILDLGGNGSAAEWDVMSRVYSVEPIITTLEEDTVQDYRNYDIPVWRGAGIGFYPFPSNWGRVWYITIRHRVVFVALAITVLLILLRNWRKTNVNAANDGREATT